MNEARVYADGFERSFAEVKDLLEFLAERGRNAKWIRKPTNTLRLAPLEKEAQNFFHGCICRIQILSLLFQWCQP